MPLSEAIRLFQVGYTPCQRGPATTYRARVELYEHPEPGLGLGMREPLFDYDPARHAYVFSDGRVHLELMLGASETRLRAGIRPGQTTGGLFPGFLIRLATIAALVQGGALLVHGCAMVSPEGEGVLFLGASGDGKTTMTRRLPGWRVLADDTVSIEGMDAGEGVWVRGTPFAGSERLPRSGERAPLSMLVSLDPGSQALSLSALQPDAAFEALVERVFCPLLNGPIPARIVDLATSVVAQASAFRLSSNLTHALAPVFDRQGA